MLYRSPRARLRIPHHLAAVAALVLLITAWTGPAESPAQNPAETPNADAQARAEQASVETARLPEGDGSDRRVDTRTGAGISLMLFRFK